jgi:hypothetical protein
LIAVLPRDAAGTRVWRRFLYAARCSYPVADQRCAIEHND